MLRPRRGREPYDAIVAIDCRPAARTLDVVVDPSPPGVTVLAVRTIALDAAAQHWIATRIELAAFIGFEP